MAKYHINDAGVPGTCTAKIQCRFGGDAQHYSSPEIAQKAYELSMASETIPTFSKKERSEPTVTKPTSGAYDVGAKAERYVHPQGKIAEINPDGSVTAWKDGRVIRTSATAERLRKGYAAWKRDDNSLTSAEEDALVDKYKSLVVDKKERYEKRKELINKNKAYNDKYADIEGRVSYIDYSRGYENQRTIRGKNPDPKGFTRVDKTEEQKRAEEKAYNSWRRAVEEEVEVQTELEENGLGDRIPDEGNTIRVRSQAQKWLLEDELKGQISDGYWSNSSNNPYQDWSNAKIIVDPKNPGRNFHTKKDNYQLNSKSLLDMVGDRMRENVREKTNNSNYDDKDMRKDLTDLRDIFKTHRENIQ